MRKAFLEFLVAENVIPSESLENIRTVLRSAPEPIGSLAFSYGMITGADIDLILDEQRRNHRRFGEIAMAMGMLTRSQVDTLLRVQQMRAATETGEALALSGICPVDEVMAQLGRFLARASTMSVC